MIALKAAYVAILAFAAWSDARRFRIPNMFPLALLLLGVVAWFAGFPFTAPLWSHLLHFAIALGVGMLLFHFGWFGGGDAKLYAAVAFWFGLSNGILLLFVTAISGVAVILLSMLLRLLGIRFGASGGSLLKRRIAYGLAIAAGGIAMLIWVYR